MSRKEVPPVDTAQLRNSIARLQDRPNATVIITARWLTELLDRAENAESAWTNWQNVALGMQDRAESAEKKVAQAESLAERFEKAFGHSGLADLVRRALAGGSEGQ